VASPTSSALLAGGAVAVVGTLVTLAAANVIPTADEGFGAPRWIVALVGLLFVAGGLYAMTTPWTTGAQQLAIGTAIGLFFFTVMAIFFTWLTLTAARASGTLTVNGVTVPLPAIVERFMNGVLAGVFALIFDTIAVYSWWKTFRYLAARGRDA
jgi:hypothetical protein